MSKSHRKSDHKHDYKWLPLTDEVGWFTHKKICTICGHTDNRVRKTEPNE